MSVAGVSGSSFVDYDAQSVQNRMQEFRKDFQQLGQDLQSGNLSAAQSDFASIKQLQTGSSSASPTSSTSATSSTSSTSSSAAASSQNNNPVAQAFNQLSQDLQSGNLSAAQQDYATIQQDFQSQGTQEHHHHHHQHHGEGNGTNASGSDSISQLFGQLGQALQSGNLSSAQQAYSTLQQDFQQFAQNQGAPSTESSPSTATPTNETTVTAWTITISVVEETSSSTSVSLNA
jgi:soluble cytochrome b562